MAACETVLQLSIVKNVERWRCRTPSVIQARQFALGPKGLRRSDEGPQLNAFRDTSAATAPRISDG
eukprot:727106-Pyramimonas_sp.AAC.1